MNILAIGSDPHFFEEGSETRQRMERYATQFDALHIVTRAPRQRETVNILVRSDQNINTHSARVVPDVRSRLFLWPADSWIGLVRTSLRVMQCHRIDCVDAQDAGELGLAAWIVARWTNKPLRIQVHTDIMSPWYRRASWKERVRYRLALFLLPRATCIRVVSERIKKTILSHVPAPGWSALGGKCQMSNVAVLPIRTDVQKFLDAHRDPANDHRFKNYSCKIVTAGRFVDKEKNYSMLIECMQEVVQRIPGALLVIIGDGPDKVNFQFLISNFQLQRNVMLEPWRDDLPTFYKSFDLFVSSSNYEGWGRAVIEAMAANLPVIMTDVGLAGEVVRDGENGVVVPVHDKQRLTDAILRLVENKKERERLAHAARETTRSLQISEEEYLRLYKAALTSCLTK